MSWVEDLNTELFQKGKTTAIVYGNVDDVWETSDGEERVLADYLLEEVFKQKQIGLKYNPGLGLEYRDEESKRVLQEFLQSCDPKTQLDCFQELPTEKTDLFKTLNKFFEFVGPNAVLVLEQTDQVLTGQDSQIVSIIQKWAEKQSLDNQCPTTILISDNLEGLPAQVAYQSDIGKLKLLFPDERERRGAIRRYIKTYQTSTSLEERELTELTFGLNRKSVREIFIQNQGGVLQVEDIQSLKRQLVEGPYSQLLKFEQIEENLEKVAGHDQAKRRLREDASLIGSGELSSLPSGYLICGPQGAGKTFLAEHFAGEARIPLIKIKNFRENWLNLSEADLGQILIKLQNLAPVLLLVEKAHEVFDPQTLPLEGSRIYSRLLREMASWQNRGRLIWVFLTSQPELLPDGLKSTGAAEIHLPVFYAKNIVEKKLIFMQFGRKIGFNTENLLNLLQESDLREIRTGEDIDYVLRKAKRFEALRKKAIEPEEFLQVVRSYRSTQDLELTNREIQSALAEVNDLELVGAAG